MSNKIEAYFDGSCKQNPGQVGSWGFVICDPWIEKKDTIYGERITNNLAEYTALNELLNELSRLNITGVQIFGDSKLICNTVNMKWGFHKKRWKPHRKFPRLQLLAIECRDALIKREHSLQWIPRSENTVADQLTKQAYQ